MTSKDVVMQMVHENNGAITVEQVNKKGLSRGVLD